jgi:energy-coupling factor transport system permease protein
MESRCYHGGEGRTRMHQLRFNRSDLFALLITLSFIAVLIVLLVLFK